MGVAVIKKEFKVSNKLGLHARPAALLAREACRFKSSVLVAKDETEVNGKSVMGLMLLAAESGSTIRITANGPDENEVVAAIGKLFANGFDEDQH